MPKLLGSPVSFLAGFLSKSEDCPELALVTGESGAGKTTWCLELARQARRLNLAAVGLISPAVFQDGVKVGIDLLEVKTGEKRRLATKKGSPASSLAPETVTLAWNFDPAGLAWGNAILAGLAPAELLILDELGPLEILDDRGLTAGLRLVDERQYRLACVVIRPRLLPAALERWPWGEALEISPNRWEEVTEAGEA